MATYQTTGTTTGLKVFELAINLMDELDDEGKYRNDDTKEYERRSRGILNILIGELYPYSDTFKKNQEWGSKRRPVVQELEALGEEIDLDDYICRSVLPYGLAAHLLMDENPTTANFFQQRYDELKIMLSRGMLAESEDIVDVYGGLEPYNEFSAW